MAREDFDIASLARYLHLDPDKVTKLAERGHLPGRRVGGQWRFSSEEVHHWLEERLAGGDEELAHVEAVLDAAPGQPSQIEIAQILSPEAIRLPLEARTRNSVINSMVEAAMETGMLWDAGKMAEAVKARENLHSTALESGVALLHPRRPLPHILGESLLAFGRTSSGIPFGSENGRLTDLFFLICAMDDVTHLHILARLSRLLTDRDFLPGLREAQSPSEVIEHIAATERRLFPV
jgi:PTS system nitrogen regulatory IIA component